MQQVQNIQQQNMLPQASFVEKAMTRREVRLENSTAKEIENLNRLQKTGVMSPTEATALRSLALAALQIDKGQMPAMPPKNYPQFQPARTPQTFNA